MKATMQVKFLGIERFRGKANPDKVYESAVFLQETETVKVFLNDGQAKQLEGYKHLEDLQVELDISLGQKTYVTLLTTRKLSQIKSA